MVKDEKTGFKKRLFDKEIKVVTKSGEEHEKVIVDEKSKIAFETVMIYIHGGAGFAGNTDGRQKYIRGWSKELGTPVFSIDYRKSPTTKYPFIFNDIINGYMWILTFVEHILDIKIKKIILNGDSYGANMSISLTNWCIANGIR